MVGTRVDRDRAHPWRVGRAPGGEVGHLPQRDIQRHRQLALLHEHAQGIGVEASQQAGGVDPPFPRRGDVERGRGQEGAAGLKPDAGMRDLDLIEGPPEIGGGRDHHALMSAVVHGARIIGVEAGPRGGVEPERDRGDTVGQIVQDLRVDLGGIGRGMFLADVPSRHGGAERRAAAHEGGEAGHAGRVAAGGEDLLVEERLKGKSLVG
ncbi:MAG: hypothetical protein QM753_11450 [Thermomicrobiales bacterium]